MSDLKEAEQELAQLEERREKLRAAEAKLEIPDLEAFEASDDNAKVALYRVAPDHYSKLMEQLTEKNHQALVEHKKRQGTHG